MLPLLLLLYTFLLSSGLGASRLLTALLTASTVPD